MKKDGKASKFNAQILLSPALLGSILQIMVQSHELKIYILRSIVAFSLEGSSGGLWCSFLLKAGAAMRSYQVPGWLIQYGLAKPPVMATA